MSFLKKGIAVSAGQVGGIFFNMLAGIIFARLLGPSGMGQFELFRSSQTVVVTLFALGMGNASIYFLNNLKTDKTELVSTIIKASLAMSIVLYAGLFISVFVFTKYFGSVSVLGAAFYAFGAASLLNSCSLKPVLTAQLASTRMILVEQMPRVTMFLFGVFMFVLGTKHINLAIMALGIGNGLAFLLLIRYLKQYISFKTPFSRSLFKNLLQYGLKLSASDLLFVLTSNVTVMLLRYFQQSNFAQVGLYTRAVSISGMVSLIPATLGPLLYAKWSTAKREDLAPEAEFAIRISLAFSILISLFVFILSTTLVFIMYGPAFAGAASAVKILAPSLIFLCISNICNNILAADGKAGITIWILLGTFCIVTITTLLTVPVLGINGAALAVLLGNISSATAGLLVCRKLYNFNLARCVFLKKEDIKNILGSLGFNKVRMYVK